MISSTPAEVSRPHGKKLLEAKIPDPNMQKGEIEELRSILRDPSSIHAFGSFARDSGYARLIVVWLKIIDFSTNRLDIGASMSENDAERSVLSRTYDSLLNSSSAFIKSRNASDTYASSVAAGGSYESSPMQSLCLLVRETMSALPGMSPSASATYPASTGVEALEDIVLDAMYSRLFVPFRATTAYAAWQKRVSSDKKHVSESGLGDRRSVLRTDDFEYMDMMGYGLFGFVVHCRRRSTGRHYAMKVQTKAGMLDCQQDNELKNAMLEKETLMRCRHPFIVSMDYALQTTTLTMMAMDFCGSGSLYDALFQLPLKRMSLKRVRFYTAEILMALEHLHRLGIVYRDLKAQNVLLCSDGHIKLADPGMIVSGSKLPSPGYCELDHIYAVKRESSVDSDRVSVTIGGGLRRHNDNSAEWTCMHHDPGCMRAPTPNASQRNSPTPSLKNHITPTPSQKNSGTFESDSKKVGIKPLSFPSPSFRSNSGGSSFRGEIKSPSAKLSAQKLPTLSSDEDEDDQDTPKTAFGSSLIDAARSMCCWNASPGVIILPVTSSLSREQPLVRLKSGLGNSSDSGPTYCIAYDPAWERTRASAPRAVGYNGFIAPEVIMGLERSHSVDYWSLGCLMYFLLTGTKAYSNDTWLRSLLTRCERHYASAAVAGDGSTEGDESSPPYVKESERVESLPAYFATVCNEVTDSIGDRLMGLLSVQNKNNATTDDDIFNTVDMVESLLTLSESKRLGCGYLEVVLRSIKSHQYFSDVNWTLLVNKKYTPPSSVAASAAEGTSLGDARAASASSLVRSHSKSVEFHSFEETIRDIGADRWLTCTLKKEEADLFSNWEFVATDALSYEVETALGIAAAAERNNNNFTSPQASGPNSRVGSVSFYNETARSSPLAGSGSRVGSGST